MTLKQPKGPKSFPSNIRGIRLSYTHQTTNSLIARPLSEESLMQLAAPVLGQGTSNTLTIYAAHLP